jgi:itaconyl-CoA hydratase
MTYTAFYHAGPNRYREHFGLFLEEFAPGMRFAHRPGVTLSQQDNVDETLDSYNGAQIHFDARYAGNSSWRRPLMVSTLTVQRLVGMISRTFGCRRDITGFREISLSSPVFGGDTIYAESEVLEVGPARDGVGLVVLRIVGRKDRDNGGEPLAEPMVFANLVMEVEIHTVEAYRAIAPFELGEPAREPRFACYREQDGARIEQCGLFFEDARAGESFVHSPRRSFFRADLVTHARRAFDFYPGYHDAGVIARQQGGRLCVPETVVLGAVTALTTRTFGRVSANLGWTGIRLAPVFEDDTLEAESTVVEARESKSRPNEGVLTVDTSARNQHGEEVCRYRRNLLVYRRDGDTPYAKAGY